jgi:hypothetical protein
LLASHCKTFFDRYDADLFSVHAHKANRLSADSLIHPCLVNEPIRAF